MKLRKFDLIFSLGEACSSSETLRRNLLQLESYPFDWLYGSDFIGRCHILTNNFENFIEKENLEYAHEERSIKCIAYRNKSNDITFNHDFSKELPFDGAYGQVKQKYTRRITRLLKKIQNSKDVLAVWLEIPSANHKTTTNQEIIDGFNILKSKFGEKINLLYVANHSEKYFEQDLGNDKITKITLPYKKPDDDFDHLINHKKLARVFRKYTLKLPFGSAFKQRVIRVLVRLIPKRSIRNNLKKKFHIY